MTLIVVLILIGLGYAAYRNKDRLLALASRVQAPKTPEAPPPEASSPPPVVTPAPVAPTAPNVAPAATITDLLFGKPDGKPVEQGPVTPAIDTSGPVLDFAVVGNGVPILLNGPKRIENCPPSVEVEIVQASGQTGAANTYTATINGVETPGNSASEFKSNNLGLVIHGPTVTVSVSTPGLQMQIRG